MKAKKWILKKHFCGYPDESNFCLEEEELPEIKDGEFLCEAVSLSVDPYMRLFGNTLPEGATMMGEQVAKVLESKNPDFPKDAYVALKCGWRSHTISKGEEHGALVLDDMQGLPESLSLGILGMPGGTAYFGLLELGEAKEGDTVYVNGAAGAVGSTVGQLAKIKGCKVIGSAGTDKKAAWLKEKLGFDHVINYKTCDLIESLKKVALDGIDIFYDVIGGEMTAEVIKLMKFNGRVMLAGTLSGYNDKDEQKGALPYNDILMKELKVRGFTFFSYMHRRKECMTALTNWIKEGKLKYHENIVRGFESMPLAFMDIMIGQSMGKTVVYV